MRVIIKFTKFLALAALVTSVPAMVSAADYTAQSPANRVALVELYSSEGCNSCPPADKWLSKIGAQDKTNNIVPLALHVDYWDNLGWKDRFGDPRFTARQRELADFANSRVVYTPEIFVGGKELRRWSSGDAFDGAIKNIVAQQSPADISIKLKSTAARTFDLTSSITLRQDSKDKHNAYVALYENKLVSNVSAGENGGVTLHHDYVVRRWLGPFALKNGVVQIQEKIALDRIAPDIRADHFGIVTFVQNAVSGEVMQAANLVVDH